MARGISLALASFLAAAAPGTIGAGGAAVAGAAGAPSARSGAEARAAATLPPAPVWPMAAKATPTRPAPCPALPATTTHAPATTASPATPQAPATTTAKATPHRPRPPATPHAPSHPNQASQTGDPLWPPLPAGSDPETYASYRTPVTSPPTVPTNWAQGGDDWKLASTRSSDPAVSSNPQELCGVEGSSADEAWQTTTGRPTTVIAVLDSGIEWCSPGIVDKIALNRSALPPPENAAGETKQQLEDQGQSFPDADPYDLDSSGVLDVQQYVDDPRVAATAAAYRGLYCASSGGYTGISPEDLIRTFGDPTLPGGAPNTNYYGQTGPAGYTEAIAGWDVLDDTNDPVDDVSFGHGTGEANDMAGAADNLSGEVGSCPNCMILPVRVGTSFVTTGNDFADGVLFAVDSGATVVSNALGVLDQTETATQAIAYANARGVPIIGSAADEEAEHQNLPGAMGHVIVVNSSNSETGWNPPSYLYTNGCTNYGATISVTVPSSSCSSEATGKGAGVLGLLESAAANAVEAGKLKDYPGLHDALGRPVPLSANEVQQLVTMSADDVDFATAAPSADPPAPADDYAVSSPNVPVARTKMFPTTPGWDAYSGWGRIDALRMVRWVTEGRIPPEAEIDSPASFRTFAPSGNLVVQGMVGAVRSTSYRYQVDVAPGLAPQAGSWRVAGEGSGHGSRRGVLATIPLAALAALFPGGAASLTGGPVGAGGQPQPDRFTFTIRLVVEDAGGLVGVDQASDFLHSDPGLVTSVQFGSSVVAPPRLAPLGPGGEDVLVVALADGTVEALLPDGKELPGWPVHTRRSAAHPAESAYTSRLVTSPPHGEILGGVAIGDLRDAHGSALDVVATDMAGNVYAWNARGQPLPGWPVRSDPAFSGPAARDSDNRMLPSFFAAPSLADLTGDGQLDVVAASLDRHVYAWAPGATPVPGWPVLVVDPSEVESVDPTTNHVAFKAGANPDRGGEIVDTPAVGALDGAGRPEIVVGTDEQYGGAANANLGALGLLLSSAGAPTANSRVYAIWPDGSDHPAAPGASDPAGFPDPGAFVKGWPASVAQLDAGVLPTIGDGVTGSPALADLSGNGRLDVVTASSAGPVYVLRPDGSSYLGATGGLPNVGAYAPAGGGLLDWTMPALGSPVVAPVGRSPSRPSIVAPAASVGKLLDVAFPGEQTPNENEADIWSATTGALAPSGPVPMNDLQFLDQPVVADVNGTEAGSFVVQASALYDLRAYGPDGKEAPGFPKFTGGWTTGGAAFGPWGSLPDQVLAAGTRSGSLLVWRTPTPACAPSGPWPQVHHDLSNSQDLSATGAAAPACDAAPTAAGYRLAASDGGVFAFHQPFAGSAPAPPPAGLGRHLHGIVAMIASPSGGYWLVGPDGGVYAFGTRWYGSLPGRDIHLGDIVGAAPTFDGGGYWLVTRTGSVYAFGDAAPLGGIPAGAGVSDVVGIASPDPGGYWLVGRDGGIFSFGDVPFRGSCPSARSGCRGVDGVVGVAAPDSGGYWLVGRDGAVFSFGDARYRGSCPAAGSGCAGVTDVVGISHPDAGGYWLAEADGALHAFGDARDYGSEAGAHLDGTIVGVS